jgi:hypothetical protein
MAAPNGAEQNAARPAVPPAHCALQPPHGPYCHCALLQAFVLRDKHSASVRRHVLDANDAKFVHSFHAALSSLSHDIVMCFATISHPALDGNMLRVAQKKLHLQGMAARVLMMPLP